MRASIAFRIFCGVLLAIAAQHSASAQSASRPRQWYEYYDEGVRAVQQQRWQPAIDNLLAAQKARAQQSRRVAFYGDRIDAYVPDYYLGLAYTGLGRFAEADAAFQRVAAQKLVVAGDSVFQTFQTQSARARTEATALAARAQQTPAQTAANPPAGAGAGPASPTQQNAQAAAPSPAQTAAPTPETTLAAGTTKSPEAVAPSPAPTTAPPAPTSPTQATTGSSPAPILPGVRVPSILRMPEAAARSALTRAGLAIGARSSAVSSAAAGTVIAQSPQPGALVQAGARVDLRLSVAPVAARATERDGIAAFFGGDYAAATQILEAIAVSDGKAGPTLTSRARMYLAASLAAEVLVGQRDRGYLEEARTQLAQAGSLAAFAADRRLISPRILAALGAQQ